MTMLRQGGRALRAESQKPLTGDVHTKEFKAGDTWVKVLAFDQSNCAPGMIELYDPKVKECLHGQATMVIHARTVSPASGARPVRLHPRPDDGGRVL